VFSWAKKTPISALKALGAINSRQAGACLISAHAIPRLSMQTLLLRRDDKKKLHSLVAASRSLPIVNVDDGVNSMKKTQACDYTTLCALASELQVYPFSL